MDSFSYIIGLTHLPEVNFDTKWKELSVAQSLSIDGQEGNRL